MRTYSRNTQTPKIMAAATALVLCVGGGGYAAWQSLSMVTPDQQGCFAQAPQPPVAVFIDSSEPRFNVVQARDIHHYLKQLYDGLPFNARLSLYTSAQDQVGSVLKPALSVCGAARSADELEAIGAQAGSAGYLAKHKERLFERQVKPVLDNVLSLTPDQSQRQNRQSPVLETLKALSELPSFDSGGRMVVISDMIQSTLKGGQFCVVRGAMPRFSRYAQNQFYQNYLKPKPFEGIAVDVLLLQRYGYGRGILKHCRSEGELLRFWQDYFKANGTRASIKRIRHGHA